MTTITPSITPYPPDAIANAIARAIASANDLPSPEEDTNRTASKYAAIAQDFRSSAWQRLDEGDLPQASNKAWGLVAQTVKAVAAHHGHIIHTHRALWQTVTALAHLVGDSGDPPTRDWIANSFGIARNLHTNFYEDEATELVVLAGLIQCEELSQRLYELFWPAAPTTTARQ